MTTTTFYDYCDIFDEEYSLQFQLNTGKNIMWLCPIKKDNVSLWVERDGEVLSKYNFEDVIYMSHNTLQHIGGSITPNGFERIGKNYSIYTH